MNRILDVLVACESSGTVRDAFRKLGHNSWSCDLLPCDGDPLYHVQGDVLKLLQRKSSNMYCAVDQWDLMIAHPPCTYLCNSGVRWLWTHWDWTSAPRPEDVGARTPVKSRWEKMREAVLFFIALRDCGIPRIAIENPIMHGHATCFGGIRKPDQIIQPYQFGHPESKATCLWLRSLPVLKPTNIVKPTNGSAMHKLPPSKDRWKLRSKTYQGIADAMAEQWSEYICTQK